MTEIRYSLRGEIDVATAPQVRQALLSLVGRDGTDLVIDATHLNFIDSTGVAVLLEANDRLEAEGRRLCIVNASRGPRRVLEGLGLSDLLQTDDGMDGDASRPAERSGGGGS
jgi:anti-sigma B factor antagonist